MAGMGSRDRLIVEWALMTGARRMEIAGLKLTQLPAIESARSDDQRSTPSCLETLMLDQENAGKVQLMGRGVKSRFCLSGNSPSSPTKSL